MQSREDAAMSGVVAEVPLALTTLSSWSRGTLHEYLQQDALTFKDARTIWQALLGSLSVSGLSEKQITSTCNCLRIFLKSISTAKSRDVRELPLARDAWIGCYHVVCDAWPRAKAKPLVQVLEALLQTTKIGMSEGELISMWRSISLELSAVILDGQPTRHLKRALALSAFFLEKELPYEIYYESARQNIRQSKRPVDGDDKSDSHTLTCVIHSVLLAFEEHDAQSSAEKCFKTLLKASVQDASDLQSWWSLVRNFVADHIDSLDTIANSIFPVLLEQQSLNHLDMIQSKRESENKETLLFRLALLQSLREREMVNETELVEFLHRTVTKQATGSPDAIGLLLCHAVNGVRVRALRLLVTSKMTNAPVSLPILRHLQQSIPLWFRPGGSRERGELLSVIRRLLIRLRGGSSAIEKSAHPSPGDLELLNAHKKLIAMLIASILPELRPNVSYQRRIMGLSIYKFLLESSIDHCDRSPVPQSRCEVSTVLVQKSNDPDWPFSLCLRKISIAQDLLNLASDSYEDVRAISTSVLKHLLATGPNTSHSQLFSEQLQAAIAFLIPKLEAQAAQTNRSDHADGLGRVYALYESIQQRCSGFDDFANGRDYPVLIEILGRLERVFKDTQVFEKSDPEPLHSLLLGVMYCKKYNSFEVQNRVISICRQVWRAVADRLCVDSPEMTDEDDADDFEHAVAGPKDMLSYSWRALRDSSLLLRSQLNAPQGIEPSKFLQTLSNIGHMCMEQLTRLRHRGAFSTVAQTFTLCCQRTMDIQGQELLGLRLQWYQEAEAQVDQQADRLTRRSAGLPAMMAAILSADHDRSFRIFVDSFIARSQITAVDEKIQKDRISLPQVHAMNTLREVMINSRFRNAIVPHLQKLLMLATTNLGSNIWAVQNCGLMLYRVCLLRLPDEDDSEHLGSEPAELESQSTPIRLALDLLRSGTHRTPQSPGSTRVISCELEGQYYSAQDTVPVLEFNHDSGLVGVEQRFAALDMIANVLPMKDLKHEVCAHLFELLSSPVWLIRERAAEVLAFLTPFDELRQKLSDVFDGVKANITQNKLHGTLLYGRQLLKRRLADTNKLKVTFEVEQIMLELLLVVAQASSCRLAPPVWAAMFEIANDLSEQSLRTEIRNNLPLLDHEGLSSKADIRGYYLPETALMYNMALNLAMSDTLGIQENVVFSVLLDRMVSDPNVAEHVLGRMLRQALVFQPRELLQLCQLLSPRTRPDFAPFVIDMVALSAERSSSKWDAMNAQQVLDLIGHSSPTREIGASSLLVQARLFPLLTLQRGHRAEFNAIAPRQEIRFEQRLRYTAGDELDRFARLQAAKALSVYLLLQPRTGSSSFLPLCTLRDLLNDDDEDVRSLAARTTSTFLSRDNGDLQLGLLADGICAPAAVIQLEDRLRSVLSEHALQLGVLLCRLFDSNSNVSLESYLGEMPVGRQLKMIENESRALFAIEKQNLYIDSVQEIRFWSSLCRVMTKPNLQLPESVKTALASWVVDGLSSVLAILKGLDDATMIPNVTHNLDILLLCLRVVNIAGVYVTLLRNKSLAHASDSTVQRIRQQLEDLKTIGNRCHLNPELTRTVDENLEAVMA